MTREQTGRGQMRPSYIEMSGMAWWERIPPLLTRPVLRVLLVSLSWGLALRSRVSWSVRSQVTRTLTLDITTADGVRRRWMFDGQTRRISSTSRPDVDYPNLGIRHVRNHMSQCVLDVLTTAATPSKRGDRATFTVDRLPDPAAVTVKLDGQDHPQWRVTGADSITIDLDIDAHQLQVRF